MKTGKKVICALMVCIMVTGSYIPVKAERYSYDNLGRVIGVEYDDGSKVIYTYDANGNITSIKVIDSVTKDNIKESSESTGITDTTKEQHTTGSTQNTTKATQETTSVADEKESAKTTKSESTTENIVTSSRNTETKTKEPETTGHLEEIITSEKETTSKQQITTEETTHEETTTKKDNTEEETTKKLSKKTKKKILKLKKQQKKIKQTIRMMKKVRFTKSLRRELNRVYKWVGREIKKLSKG